MAISRTYETRMAKVLKILDKGRIVKGSVSLNDLTIENTITSETVNWQEPVNSFIETAEYIDFIIEAGNEPNVLVLDSDLKLKEGVTKATKRYYQDLDELLDNLNPNHEMILGQYNENYDFAVYETSKNIFDYGGVSQHTFDLSHIEVVAGDVAAKFQSEVVDAGDWTMLGDYQVVKVMGMYAVSYWVIRASDELSNMLGNRSIGYAADSSNDYKVAYDLDTYKNENFDFETRGVIRIESIRHKLEEV